MIPFVFLLTVTLPTGMNDDLAQIEGVASHD